jgi:hypothetical protein
LIVRVQNLRRSTLWLLAFAAPGLAGCSGASDLLSRDAEWFSRSGRVFTKNVAIETPPLSSDRPVGPEDLITADGACPGMAPSGPASALTDAGATQPSGSGIVALGHTECDVARGAGVPNNVSISANNRGDRVALLTYLQGPRAGIYTFTAGRLTSIEAAPQAAAPPRTTKQKRRSAG